MINQDIFFIRHAESKANQATFQCIKKHNIALENLTTAPEFIALRYDPALIDCSITQKGQKQCSEAREEIDKLQPDVILVSPAERCLQTCELLFSGRNIPRIVEPSIAESFTSSCDVGSQLQGKKKRFPAYDFANVEKVGDLWFIKNDCEQNQKKYFSHLEEKNLETHDEKTKQICNVMGKNSILQGPLQMQQRAKKVRQLLKEYKKKYNQIAIVTHYGIVNYIIAKEYNEKNEPVQMHKLGLKNCGIKKVSLEDISSE